ncbi:MAG: ASCH domain-containing protein [Clostridia bacterium]|nr:ASCH domain-containing protein [Clostridia bacterium]
MKTVFLPVHPNWLELILSGKKTVEVRKTKPKEAAPFRVILYCTEDFKNYATKTRKNELWIGEPINSLSKGRYIGNGKVIGEFLCDKMYQFIQAGAGIMFADENYNLLTPQTARKMTCLDDKKIDDYLGEKDGYGWHISDLKIYDKPKELSEFGLKRAPQSWCYVRCEK